MTKMSQNKKFGLSVNLTVVKMIQDKIFVFTITEDRLGYDQNKWKQGFWLKKSWRVDWMKVKMNHNKFFNLIIWEDRFDHDQNFSKQDFRLDNPRGLTRLS